MNQSVEPKIATHASAAKPRGNVIVSGATSQIGRFLLPRLVAAGYCVYALSRKAAPEWSAVSAEAQGLVTWVRADIGEPASLAALPQAQALIHLAPLAILPSALASFSGHGVRRVVAFSSSSKHSKAKSPVAAERAFAARLAAAEQALAEQCTQQDMRWTVFRPTLIYGCGMDRNVTVIRRIIRLCGFFPLLGVGVGRRQPVHADDLAAACIAVLEQSQCMDKAYELCGGETLSYRTMVERIFASVGRKPRFLIIPLALFGLALRVLSLIPRYKDFNSAMAQRMNEHLEYSDAAARVDFGYQARSFTP